MLFTILYYSLHIYFIITLSKVMNFYLTKIRCGKIMESIFGFLITFYKEEAIYFYVIFSLDFQYFLFP